MNIKTLVLTATLAITPCAYAADYADAATLCESAGALSKSIAELRDMGLPQNGLIAALKSSAAKEGDKLPPDIKSMIKAIYNHPSVDSETTYRLFKGYCMKKLLGEDM